MTIVCDGAALLLNGEWSAVGSTPAIDEIGPVLRMLERENVGTLWETNELRAHHGLVENITRVAGVLAIPLSGTARNFLLLFRDEQRLTPQGLADCREEVRGRATPWSDADRSAAEAIKAYLSDLALTDTELLASRTPH